MKVGKYIGKNVGTECYKFNMWVGKVCKALGGY